MLKIFTRKKNRKAANLIMALMLAVAIIMPIAVAPVTALAVNTPPSQQNNSTDAASEPYDSWLDGWATGNTYDGLDSVFTDDSSDPSNQGGAFGWFEELLEGAMSLLLRVTAGGLLSKMADDFDMTVETVIYGRVGTGDTNYYQFGLEDGNIYGSIGAILYALLRNVVFALFAIQFVYILGAYMLKGTGKGRADLKTSIYNFMFMFAMLYAMPIVVDIILFVRDAILKLFVTMSQQVTGSYKIGITDEVMNMCADDWSLVSTLIMLCMLGCGIAFAASYIKIALQELYLFGVFPVVAYRSFSDRQIFNKWIGHFVTALFVPVLDAVGIWLVVLVQSLGTSSGSTSGGRLILALLAYMSIIPCRNAICQLFGMPVPGRGFNLAAAAMMMMRMMSGPSRRDGGGEDNKNKPAEKGDNGKPLSDTNARRDNGDNESIKKDNADEGISRDRNEGSDSGMRGNGKDDISQDDDSMANSGGSMGDNDDYESTNVNEPVGQEGGEQTEIISEQGGAEESYISDDNGSGVAGGNAYASSDAGADAIADTNAGISSADNSDLVNSANAPSDGSALSSDHQLYESEPGYDASGEEVHESSGTPDGEAITEKQTSDDIAEPDTDFNSNAEGYDDSGAETEKNENAGPLPEETEDNKPNEAPDTATNQPLNQEDNNEPSVPTEQQEQQPEAPDPNVKEHTPINESPDAVKGTQMVKDESATPTDQSAKEIAAAGDKQPMQASGSEGKGTASNKGEIKGKGIGDEEKIENSEQKGKSSGGGLGGNNSGSSNAEETKADNSKLRERIDRAKAGVKKNADEARSAIGRNLDSYEGVFSRNENGEASLKATVSAARRDLNRIASNRVVSTATRVAASAAGAGVGFALSAPSGDAGSIAMATMGGAKMAGNIDKARVQHAENVVAKTPAPKKPANATVSGRKAGQGKQNAQNTKQSKSQNAAQHNAENRKKDLEMVENASKKANIPQPTQADKTAEKAARAEAKRLEKEALNKANGERRRRRRKNNSDHYNEDMKPNPADLAEEKPPVETPPKRPTAKEEDT